MHSDVVHVTFEPTAIALYLRRETIVEWMPNVLPYASGEAAKIELLAQDHGGGFDPDRGQLRLDDIGMCGVADDRCFISRRAGRPPCGQLQHRLVRRQCQELFGPLPRDIGHSRVPDPPDRMTGTINGWTGITMGSCLIGGYCGSSDDFLHPFVGNVNVAGRRQKEFGSSTCRHPYRSTCSSVGNDGRTSNSYSKARTPPPFSAPSPSGNSTGLPKLRALEYEIQQP